jgi:hypothetical protein
MFSTTTVFASDEAAEDFLNDLGAELPENSNELQMVINGSAYEFIIDPTENMWALRSELEPVSAIENLWRVYPDSPGVLAMLMEAKSNN